MRERERGRGRKQGERRVKLAIVSCIIRRLL